MRDSLYVTSGLFSVWWTRWEGTCFQKLLAGWRQQPKIQPRKNLTKDMQDVFEVQDIKVRWNDQRCWIDHIRWDLGGHFLLLVMTWMMRRITTLVFFRYVFVLNCKALCWQQGQLENSVCCLLMQPVYHKDEVSLIGWCVILSWLGYSSLAMVIAWPRPDTPYLTVIEYPWIPRMWRDNKMQIFWHNCVVFGLWLGMITPVSLNDCFVWHLCSFLIIQLLKWESLLWNCQNPKWTLVFARCAWLCVFLFCCLCVSVFWISFSK